MIWLIPLALVGTALGLSAGGLLPDLRCELVPHQPAVDPLRGLDVLQADRKNSALSSSTEVTIPRIVLPQAD